MRFVFEDNELDVEGFALRRSGALVHIQPKALELLLYLVRHRDRMVSVDELLGAVWPGVSVTRSSLNRAVSLARSAIGDEGPVATAIATIPRRGYRFIAPVVVARDGAEDREPAVGYVGRSAMLERLGTSVDAGLRGAGRLILLAGEPGIGKTRTAEWIADRARSARAEVVAVWGIPISSPTFGPWSRVLRRLAEAAPGCFDLLTADQRAALAGLSSPDGLPDSPSRARGSETARFLAFEAMTAVLGQLSRIRPFLLVFDDLHAADPESIHMLEYVGRSLASHPGVVVATLREHDSRISRAQLAAIDGLHRLGNLERWALTGLAGRDLEDFVSSKSEREVPASLREALERQTNGNPLLLEQSLRSLESSPPSDLELSADEWARRLPQGIGHLVHPKLAQLSFGARDVLAIAATVGREIEVELLRRCLVEIGGFEDRLAEVLAQGLLLLDSSGTRLRFPHALIQGAVHEALVPGARESRALHARVLEGLEASTAASTTDGGRLAEAAHHACAAVPGIDPMKAAALAERAAEQADRLFDFEGAARWCERGLEALADGRPIPWAHRASLLLRLARACVRTQGLERARTTFLRATDAARVGSDAPLFALSVLGLAHRPNSTGRADAEVTNLLREAIALLEGTGDEAIRVRLLSRLAAEIRYDEGVQARALASEALAGARALGDPSVLSQTLEDCTFLQWSPSDPRAWIALNAELAVQARLANDLDLAVSGHKGCVSGALELGDIAAAARETRACERIAKEVPTPYARWWVEVLGASRSLVTGDFEAAERQVFESLRIAERIESPEVGIESMGQICYLRVEQGRAGEIVDAARDQVRLFPGQPTWRAALARILLGDGQVAEARQVVAPLVASRFAAVPEDRGWLATHALSAEVVAFAADRAGASVIADRLRPFAELTTVIGSAIYYGPVSHYLGILAASLGRFDEAIERFDQALEAEDRAAAIVFSLRTRLARADAHHRRGAEGDRARAVQGVKEVLGACESRPYGLLKREARELAGLVGLGEGAESDGAVVGGIDARTRITSPRRGAAGSSPAYGSGRSRPSRGGPRKPS